MSASNRTSKVDNSHIKNKKNLKYLQKQIVFLNPPVYIYENFRTLQNVTHFRAIEQDV